MVIKELEILQQSLQLKDKYRILNSSIILQSLSQLKEITKNKIRKHNHPIPYDFNYKDILEKIEVDIETRPRIRGFSSELKNNTPFFTDGSKFIESESEETRLCNIQSKH